jgi:hypothetical protein
MGGKPIRARRVAASGSSTMSLQVDGDVEAPPSGACALGTSTTPRTPAADGHHRRVSTATTSSRSVIFGIACSRASTIHVSSASAAREAHAWAARVSRRRAARSDEGNFGGPRRSMLASRQIYGSSFT